MSRRREAPKRVIIADPKYLSVLLAKFINVIMTRGKKAVAEKIVYSALDIVAKKLAAQDPLEIFNTVIDNLQPTIEVKSKRLGGANYQVPVEVRAERRKTLAMRWLREAAKKRGEKGMDKRLAGELLDAYENRGGAMKKREDVYRMAEANKAFSHLR